MVVDPPSVSDHRAGAWTDDRSPARSSDPERLRKEGIAIVATAVFVAAIGSVIDAVWMGAIALVVGTRISMRKRREERRRSASARLIGLRKGLGAGPSWPVDLAVRQGEAPTGYDQGLLWIEREGIAFCGLRTSFLLTPSQVVGEVRHQDRVAGIRYRLNLRLDLQTTVGPLSISFWPTDEGDEETAAADLRFALNTRLRSTLHPSTVGGHWPPTAIGPAAPTPGTLWRAAFAECFPRVLIPAALAASLFWSSAPPFGLFVFLIGSSGLLYAFRERRSLRFRAAMDARRARF